MGAGAWGREKQGVPRGWWGHAGLSLLGPELGAGTKSRELPVTGQVGRLGQIITGVTVWLPGLVPVGDGRAAWLQTGGQSCIFIHGLAIVLLYIWSLRPETLYRWEHSTSPSPGRCWPDWIT